MDFMRLCLHLNNKKIPIFVINRATNLYLMRNMKAFIILSCLCLFSPIFSNVGDPLLSLPMNTPSWSPLDSDNLAQNKNVYINNRILANINGSPISVMDVMKKMDMVFYKQYPQYASSPEARFQFYYANWRPFLKEIIHNELIYSDAKEKKLPLSDGEIREELEKLFGPNVVFNIDKAGLTFEEVWQMIERELSVRRMFQYRVMSKALNQITPDTLREAYTVFAEKNKRPAEWRYKFLTVKSDDLETSQQVAEEMYSVLLNKGIDALENRLADSLIEDSSVSLQLSEEFYRTEKDIAASHKEILASLPEGGVSKPIQQLSRSNNQTLYRIFYLIKETKSDVLSFSELQDQIYDEMFNKAIDRYSEEYLSNLRRRFGVDEDAIFSSIPENFEPFSLQ